MIFYQRMKLYSPLALFALSMLYWILTQGMLFYGTSKEFSCVTPKEEEIAFLHTLTSPINGPTFRASLAHWMGPMNIAAYEAWIVYHHKRWSVTDVDLHVHWENTKKMETYFNDNKRIGGANVKVFGHYVDKDTPPDKYTEAMGALQRQIMQRTLANAKQHGNDFIMNIDADEFLDSNDFESIESIFASNKTIAVTMPIFSVDYKVCTGVALDFGSLGYQGARPIRTNYTSDKAKHFYTDSCVACCGNRKYIVRSDSWNHLAQVHDPVDCGRLDPFEGIIDMSGRAEDHQHLRILHIRSINADTSFHACESIRSCEFIGSDKTTCVNSMADASLQLVPSKIQKILSGFQLFDNINEFVKNATCYAKQYPELQEEFCPSLEPSTCEFGNLLNHYDRIGESKNWKWGCSA